MAAYRRARVVSALLALCWLAPSSPARAQRATAPIPKNVDTVISGVVREPNEQVATGALVIAENEVTGQQWQTRSGRLGRYEFMGIPPGRYTVMADSERFGLSVTTGVEVRRTQKTGHDIKLGEGHKELVTVQSRAEERTVQRDGSLGATFSVRSLETRPLSHGNTLQSLLPPVPGIVVTESVGTHAQFTTLGQRRFENRLVIDGVSADLGLDVSMPGIGQAESGALPALGVTGGTQTLLPLAAVEEIRITTTNAAPELARAPGAQTVIVTRAGGEKLTGAAFVNVRPNRFRASDWFENAGRTPKRQTQYGELGAALGGPLLPQRIHYFMAGERQRIDRPVSTTIPVPSDTTREQAPANVRPLFDAYPRPNGRELGEGLAQFVSLFPVTSTLSSLSVRLDGTLAPSHRVFTRVNRGTSHGDEIGPDTGLPRLSFSHREHTSTTTGTIGLTSALSSRLLNELKANVTDHRGAVVASPADHGDAGPLPLDLLLPGSAPGASAAINLFPDSSGILMSGRTAASRQQQIQVNDTISFATTRHEWRIGFDFAYVTTSSAAPDRYSYRFLSLSDLRVRVLVDRFLGVRAKRESWSLFAQDTFRVSPRLSLNYGFRYDVQPAPASLTDVDPVLMQFEELPALQPRQDTRPWWKTSRVVGSQMAGSYLLGNTTSLHAGWALTYAPLSSPGEMPFRGSPYWTSRALPISTFPVAQSALEAPTNARDYYSFPEDLRRPRTYDWYFGVDHGIRGAQRLNLVYVGTLGRDLVYWHSYDVGTSRVNGFVNAGNSTYHALLAKYVRRLSRPWQAEVVYTWSHAIDTDSGEPLGPHPPPSVISPEANRGSADYDRRHILNATASYHLPTPRLPTPLRNVCSEWRLDAVFMAISGAPVTVMSNRRLDTGTYWLRADVVPQNPVWIADRDSPTGQQLNPDAFLAPSDQQGTHGRNVLRASPLRQINLSLSRPIPLGGRLTGQLRIDAYNVFNIPSFGPPESRLTYPYFGQSYRSYADALGTGTLSRGGLVPVQQTGGPRSIQIGFRVSM